MRILAIETSCDDTCISILKAKGSKVEIESNIVSSQVKAHQKWGGVYPSLAKREHQKNLVPVLSRALREAGLLKIQNSKKGSLLNLKTSKDLEEREPLLLKKLSSFLKKYKKPKIDLIAVTAGPGLEPCLWIGINFAKALGDVWQIQVAPINHIEAHIFANLLSQINSKPLCQNLFPALSLIVSGGHTQLILIKELGKYGILGETRDDAAGECLDKIARVMGLGYPGGPKIAKESGKYKGESKYKIELPRPMIHQKNYDFSFSGLKTAVLYDFKKRPLKERASKEYIQEMSYNTQQAIIDVLILKTLKAAKDFKVKTIMIGGGVAANKELRKRFKQKIKEEVPKVKYLVPEIKRCTDNAAMVAITAYSHWLEGDIKSKNIKANSNYKL